MKPAERKLYKNSVELSGLTQPDVFAGPSHIVVVGEVILQARLGVQIFLPALNIHHQGDRCTRVHHSRCSALNSGKLGLGGCREEGGVRLLITLLSLN